MQLISPRLAVCLGILLALGSSLPQMSAQPFRPPSEAEALVRKAVEQRQKGQADEALKTLDQAIEQFPKDGASYFYRARLRAERMEWPEAAKDCAKAIELDFPQKAACHQMLGEIYFRLNRPTDSVAEFDQLLVLKPDQKPYHWQRGISLYYAGKYEEGQKQFELHQNVNSQDVENAVWHFLCAAKTLGLEKARSLLIPINADSRVPMAEVHDLYRGVGSEEKVLAACQRGTPGDEALKNNLFYAHLYLGLYNDALGNREGALKHISKAANDYAQPHYMGDVARVHWAQLRQKPAR